MSQVVDRERFAAPPCHGASNHMSTQTSLAVLLAAAAIATPAAFAADSSESLQLQALQRQVDAMRQDYEARLKALESRLGQAEAGRAAPAAPAAPTTAVDARPAAAEPSVPGVTQVTQDTAPPSSSGGFNPAIALILSGSYANLSQDPAHYRITGFLTGSEIGPGVQGFSLGESELNISASVDPWFYGALNLSVAADNSVSIEEAFVQTTALPEGMTLRAGRTLSGIGYLNDKHAHTWDFADSPLVYQAFLDGQLKQDGLQLRVLLPTPQFVEIGGELGAAGPFPSGGSNGNRPAMATLFAHTGGDVGSDSSWRAGLSTVWARANDRASSDVDSAGNDVTSLFNGTSRLFIVDGVWKWAPNGNPQRTNRPGAQHGWVRSFDAVG